MELTTKRSTLKEEKKTCLAEWQEFFCVKSLLISNMNINEHWLLHTHTHKHIHKHSIQSRYKYIKKTMWYINNISVHLWNQFDIYCSSLTRDLMEFSLRRRFQFCMQFFFLSLDRNWQQIVRTINGHKKCLF